MLPKTLAASVYRTVDGPRAAAAAVLEGVDWQAAPAFDQAVSGDYIYTPILPEGYTAAQGVALPRITVTVTDGDALSPQFLSTLRAEGPITVTTSDQFMAALASGNSPITVDGLITVVGETDPDKRQRPIMIPGGTEIVGAGPGSQLNNWGPIQLDGDGVVFRDIKLTFDSSDSLGSIPHREIFLAGRSLTLDNVNTYLEGNDGSLGGFGGTESELLPTVYAGGYRGTDVGDQAALTVQNANSETMFKSIYMGHDAGQYDMTPYTGSAVLNLDARTLSRSGVYTDRFALDYIDGSGWVASKLYEDTNAPTIGSIEILSAPTAVNVDELHDEFGRPTPAAFRIVWRDENNNTISGSTVYDWGFCNGGSEGSYAIIMKSAYLSGTANDSKTDWGSGASLEKIRDEPSDVYYLYGDPANVKEGNYTILFLSEPVNISDDPVSGSRTVGYVKQEIAGKVLAQTSFDLYKPAAGATDIGGAAIAPIDPQTYTGRMITPLVTVTYQGAKLTAGIDYVVSYANNINPGQAEITVTGIGNYSGEKTANFQIVKASADVSLTVNGGNNATVSYGDTLCFVFQAAPKKTNRMARVAAPNTVEFVCGGQVLGTATVSADGQAVLTYQTTDRKIPIGPSPVGVRFGGSAGLEAASQDAMVTVTLNKAVLPVNSIALKDLTYDGVTKTTSIRYATLQDGSTVSLTGTAQLSDVKAAQYGSAKVADWALSGADTNWYTLPAAPAQIAVDPAVNIMKAPFPAPPDQYLSVRPGETVICPLDGLLPSAKFSSTINQSPKGLGTASYDSNTNILSFTANQTAGTANVSIQLTCDNYQTLSFHVYVTITKDAVINPSIQAADIVYNGASYDGLSGADLSKVALTYRDLTEQKDLPGAPVNAGSYSVTAKWKDGAPGAASASFEITPRPVKVQAIERTVKPGEPAPSLDNPLLGTDYTLNPPPVNGDSLGSVRMVYREMPDTSHRGRYEIMIIVQVPNPNYAITTANAYLNISDNPAVSVTGVTLNQSTLVLTAGDTAALIATVQPGNAANKAVRWSTSDPAVATVDQSGNIKAVVHGSATITVTTVDGGYTAFCVVEVQKRSGGGSSGGGSFGGGAGSSDSGRKIATKAPRPGTTRTVKPNVNGAVTIPDSSIQAALRSARRFTPNVMVVTVPVDAAAQNNLAVTLQSRTLDRLVQDKVKQFDITVDGQATIQFDQAVLAELDRQSAGGSLTIHLKKPAVLSQEAQAAIGTRPVYEIAVSYLSGGQEVPVANLNSTAITVKIPYTPTAAKTYNDLYAVYIDANGHVVWPAQPGYDARQKAVSFTTNRFGIYGVGYRKPAVS